MQENNIKNDNISKINYKIGRILENNLTSNLIIIFIGFIAALSIAVFTYINADFMFKDYNFANKFIIDRFYFYIF